MDEKAFNIMKQYVDKKVSTELPGLSAYQVAVKNGYSGTEAEWLLSLKGQDGTTPDLSSYAPKASPAFTGTPTAPTASSGTNTTQIATTAFVKNTIDNLGLSGAMHFRGIDTSGNVYSGSTIGTYAVNNGSTTNAVLGDVLLDDNEEFVWTGNNWELLGPNASFKIQQSAVSDPTASGTSTSFISSISQDANGNITASKANLPAYPSKVSDLTNDSGFISGANTSVYYGTCTVSNSVQEKTVTCSGFTLATGATIFVKMTNSQDYNGVPKLNVNSTGAIDIKVVGTTNAGRYYWQAGEVVSFTYDGTYYIMHDGATATTTYYGVTKLSSSATSSSEVLALTPKALNSTVQGLINSAPTYSSSATYAVGDIVRYSYKIYKCKTTISTAEAWNASHWEEVSTIQTQLDNKENTSNKVISISSNSTDTEYPSALAVKTYVDSVLGGIENGSY